MTPAAADSSGYLFSPRRDGETVISEIIFPKSTSDGIELYSHGRAQVLKMDIWNLKSVYR
jgi:sucrose-6-phosphate hydrolase SacC (GH32 family)